MNDTRTTYIRLCKDVQIEPQESLIQEIERLNPENTLLNLSTCSMVTEMCSVLGKLFAVDYTLTQLSLADCMLLEEGMKAVLLGLCSNRTVTSLDLKGNNMRGSGAEAVGRLLRHNHHVKNLCLEWNSLGLLPDKFALLAEGLAVNTSLKRLDLRNNQINHAGAKYLASAIKRNGYLEKLDLRWNNLGLMGCRAIQESVQYNKSLNQLQLAGIGVAADIVKTIETAISSNAERKLFTTEWFERTQRLTEEIRQLEHNKNLEVTHLMDRLEQVDEEMNNTQKYSLTKIKQLQEALDERTNAFRNLAAKVETLQATLNMAEQKNKDLSEILSQTQQDNSDLRKQHYNLLSQERKDRANSEAQIMEDLNSLKEKKLQLEQEIWVKN